MLDTPLMESDHIIWPPLYTLKRHARARHVKLRASPQQGLEIVVPTRFSVKHVPEILENNKAWIIKKLIEIQANSTLIQNEILPETIALAAFNQCWKIYYVKAKNKRLRMVVRPGEELVLLGDTDNYQDCIKLLMEWVKTMAQKHLVALLDEVSQKINLPYRAVTIRGQRSRWGSCTSEKNISLNYKLIFLPKNLAQHILIHELCHTVFLNHSVKFWRLVASFDPEWKEHEREIKHAEKMIPFWVL